MLPAVETAFVLRDRASPTVQRLRGELRELQKQAEATGLSMDAIAAPGAGRQMDKHAAAAGKTASAHTGLADAAAAGSVATKQAARDAEQAAASQEKSAKRISAAWKGAANAAASAASVHQRAASTVSRSWASSSSSLVKTGKLVLATLLATGVGALDLGVKYQASTRMFTTQAGVSQKSAAQLSDGILKMAASVGQAPLELSGGMYHVVSSMDVLLPKAHKTAIELGILRDAAKLAAVGHSNLTDTTYVLSSAMNALGQKGLHGASSTMKTLNAIVGTGDMHMQDLMGAMRTGFVSAAKTFGISLQSAGAALAYMTDRGVPATQAATRLRMSFSLLGAPTQKAAGYLRILGLNHSEVETRTHAMTKALTKAGISITDLSGDLRKPDGVIVALQDLKQHMTDAGVSSQTQAAILSRAFGGGRSGGTIMALYNNLSVGAAKYNQQTKVATQFDKDWALRQKDLSFQMNQGKAAVLALGTRLGKDLIPWVEKGITGVKDLAHWFTQHKLAAQALAGVIGGVLVASVVALGVNVARRIGGATKDFYNFGKSVASVPFRLAQWGQAKMAGGAGSQAEKEAAAVGGSRVVGWDGMAAMVGSRGNPMAVLVVDPSGSPLAGGPGSATAERTAEKDAASVGRTEATKGGVILPPGVRAAEAAVPAGVPAAEVAVPAAVVAPTLASRITGVGSKVAGIGSKVIGAGGALLGGAGIAGIGLLGTQLAKPLLTPLIGKGAADVVGTLGTAASIGAGGGSLLGPGGTAAGAVAGTITGGMQMLSAPVNKAIGSLGPIGGAAATGGIQGLLQGVPGIGGWLGSFFGGGGLQRQLTPAEKALAGVSGTIKKLHGDLSSLSPAQLIALRNEAARLSRDPSLGRYSKQLKGIATTAQNQMLKPVADNFRTMAKQAGTSLGNIRSFARLEAQQLPLILGKGSAAAKDAVAENFLIAAQDIGKSMAAGVISTGKGISAIQSMLGKALSALGVAGANKQAISEMGFGQAAAVANELATGQINQGQAQTAVNTAGFAHAKGGRLPGPARGDHIPLYSRGGGLMGIADGGELVVNRHTEAKADSFLGMFGTRLSKLVANETKPHFATGGRVGSLVTASDFNDPTTASGRSHIPGYAELSNPPGSLNFSALGHLPMGTMLGVTYPPWTGKTISIPKIDVGAGGSALPPAKVRAVDLTLEAAAELPGFGGLANVSINIGGLGAGAGAGAGGAMGVPTLKPPHVAGRGLMQPIGQAVVNKVTAAANSYLQAHAPAPAAAGMGGVPSFPVAAGPVPPAVQRAKEAAAAIAARHEPYITGGFGWGAPGLDCSGYVSTVMNAAGLMNGYLITGPLKSWGEPGPGKWITVGVLGADSGPTGHTMMEIDGTYFESGGGGGGPHVDQTPWGGQSFQWFRHPPGLEKGGRLNAGARVGEPGHQLSLTEYERFRQKAGQEPSWGGWHAKGADMTVRRPTLFGAGERGAERVQITPHGSPTHGGIRVDIRPGGIVVRGGGSEAHVKRVIEKSLEAFITHVETELLEGAEEDEGALIR